VVAARHGQQLSLIATREPALDLSEFDIAGLPGRAVRLFPWSGRNLYRPGERFELSVLARDADGRPVPPQPVQAILKRPDGKSQFTASWQPEAGSGGYYRRAIELPADAPTGAWVLELRADPADKLPTNSYRFNVEEFLPERMKLELTPSHPSLDAKQPFALAVQGSYLYGAPAAGNRLLGIVQYERHKNPLAQQLPASSSATPTKTAPGAAPSWMKAPSTKPARATSTSTSPRWPSASRPSPCAPPSACWRAAAAR
jgi:uncharacterized protein YfaS (alpha-2-macroglobulin family)